MFFSSKSYAPLSKKLMYGVSLGAIASLMAGPAMAQNTSQQNQAQDIESVTVTATGTLVKGITPVGANVATYDQAEIKSTGALTTDQLLGNIPLIANAFNTNNVSPTAGNIGGVRPSIRYNPSTAITGGAATLILMDGHNFVGVSGLATAPDPGLIPAIALKQVDVLPDGASAVYGANAVTGVINFITREDFAGFEANLALGHADSYKRDRRLRHDGHGLGQRRRLRRSRLPQEYLPDGAGPGLDEDGSDIHRRPRFPRHGVSAAQHHAAGHRRYR